MGSLVNFINPPVTQPSRVACVYCSSYRALVAFMETDVRWFHALQLQVSLAHMKLCLSQSAMLGILVLVSFCRGLPH